MKNQQEEVIHKRPRQFQLQLRLHLNMELALSELYEQELVHLLHRYGEQVVESVE